MTGRVDFLGRMGGGFPHFSSGFFGHLSPIVLTSGRCGVRFDNDVLVRLRVVILGTVIIVVTATWCRTGLQFVDNGFVNLFGTRCSLSPSRFMDDNVSVSYVNDASVPVPVTFDALEQNCASGFIASVKAVGRNDDSVFSS
jgi:hypothetical protein